MRESIQINFDPFTQGARDLRAGRPDCSGDLPEHDRASYQAGARRALQLACSRLDAGDVIPAHFDRA